MREIKFRVFVKHLGQLADVLTIDFLEREVEIYLVDRDEVRYYPFDEDEIVLLQFTGLKDKNGKEIYEWDIVRFHYKTGVYKIGTVVWNDLFGSWDIDCSDFVSYKSLGQYKSVSEVIGNIFERNHLLEADS